MVGLQAGLKKVGLGLGAIAWVGSFPFMAVAAESSVTEPACGVSSCVVSGAIALSPALEKAAQELDLTPTVVEGSPVLQRWLRQVPDLTHEIANNPSFRTRMRLGYNQFPALQHTNGWNIGIDDVFLGRSGLTVSGEYQATFNGLHALWGADLQYYLRPLGSYVNVAPVVGYRRVETDAVTSQGTHLGWRLKLVLSRGGAADVSLTQGWVAPGTLEEVGLTTLSAGYALTPSLRLSTDLQQQNSRQRQDSRAGIVLEWML